MRRGPAIAFAASLLAVAPAGSAAAQITKAVDANGSIGGGTNADVRAKVQRGSTAGEVCVSLKGYLKRDLAWERGCGPVTVEIDDLLDVARVRGSVRTGYGTGPNWWEGRYLGTGLVTLDVTVTGTGTMGPAGEMYPSHCNPLNVTGCLAPVGANRTVERSGTATGAVASQKLRTTELSAGATLYLQRRY